MSKKRKETLNKTKIIRKRLISSSDITPSSKKPAGVGLDKTISSTDLESKSQPKKIEKRKK